MGSRLSLTSIDKLVQKQTGKQSDLCALPLHAYHVLTKRLLSKDEQVPSTILLNPLLFS